MITNEMITQLIAIIGLIWTAYQEWRAQITAYINKKMVSSIKTTIKS